MLESDDQLDECLNEAQSFKSATQLRHLFAMILIHCNITDPLKLWKKYTEQFCDDIMVKEKKNIQIDENKIIKIPHYIQNIALNEIEILLNNAGKSLVDFKCFPKLTQIKNNTLINIARKYDTNILKQKVKENIIKFNSKQLNAFEEIMDRINHKSSKHNLFFISGAGGCGKTFLENTILDHVRSQVNRKYEIKSF